MQENRPTSPARWSVWLIPVLTAALGHVLLVPLFFAGRAWDIARRPFGFGHWPGEPGWPAGSGSSEFGPGVVPLVVSWLLLWLIIALSYVVASLVALTRFTRRRRRRPPR